jgi:hypothetical protein
MNKTHYSVAALARIGWWVILLDSGVSLMLGLWRR